MKFRTFRALVALGVVSLAVGGYAAYDHFAPEPAPHVRPGRPVYHEDPVAVPPPEPSEDPVREPSRPSSGPTAAASDDPGALRKLDREVLRLVKAGISGGKVKDALQGWREKVNLYRDAGHAGVNRLKIDLDRDEKWDEKWTIEADGAVLRQIAPNDDERYTVELRLVGERWAGADERAAVATPSEPAAEAAGGQTQTLRAFDEPILALAERGISGAKVKDALKGRAYKVNLYRDAGQPGVNRLKIDLDRDDKWDEKWTFVKPGSRDGGVKRQVAPNDDEVYSVEYRLLHGKWVLKQD